MHILRRTLMGASAIGLATVLAAAMISLAAPAGAAAPTLPQTAVALGAARWLGTQLTPQGTIDDVTPGTADLSATAQTVIWPSEPPASIYAAPEPGCPISRPIRRTYVTQQGSDGPGSWPT